MSWSRMHVAYVWKVNDGDTVVVRWWDERIHRFIYETIRLAMMNTSEMDSDGGEEAANALRRLLYVLAVPSGRVRFRRVGNDYFNRTIAHLYVRVRSTLAPPTNVSEWMVENGYALPVRRYGATNALFAIFNLVSGGGGRRNQRRGLWLTRNPKTLQANITKKKAQEKVARNRWKQKRARSRSKAKQSRSRSRSRTRRRSQSRHQQGRRGKSRRRRS